MIGYLCRLLVEAEEGRGLLELTLGKLLLVLSFPVLLGHLVLGVVGILASTGRDLLLLLSCHCGINSYSSQRDREIERERELLVRVTSIGNIPTTTKKMCHQA